VTGSTSSSSSQTSSSSSSAESKPAATAQKSPSIPSSTEYTTYTVKSGDSLYSIAKNYPGVSAQNIMDFNGISSGIKPGMTLRIPKL
jgi:membrane-bound lytic murein transglycosylase D